MSLAIGRSHSAAWLALVLLLPIWALADEVPAEGQSSPADIEFFTRARCAHCEDAQRFLDELARERPALRILGHDVSKEPVSAKRLQALAGGLAAGTLGVPAFYARGELVIGYAGAATTGGRIRALLDQRQTPQGT